MNLISRNAQINNLSEFTYYNHYVHSQKHTLQRSHVRTYIPQFVLHQKIEETNYGNSHFHGLHLKSVHLQQRYQAVRIKEKLDWS